MDLIIKTVYLFQVSFIPWPMLSSTELDSSDLYTLLSIIIMFVSVPGICCSPSFAVFLFVSSYLHMPFSVVIKFVTVPGVFYPPFHAVFRSFSSPFYACHSVWLYLSLFQVSFNPHHIIIVLLIICLCSRYLSIPILYCPPQYLSLFQVSFNSHPILSSSVFVSVPGIFHSPSHTVLLRVC